MVGVLVMDVALDEVVDVARMRYRIMPTSRLVSMRRIVPAALVAARAACGIGAGGADFMFVNVTVVRMMQMTIVQVIRVTVMLQAGMSAIAAVLVSVRIVRCMCCHCLASKSATRNQILWIQSGDIISPIRIPVQMLRAQQFAIGSRVAMLQVRECVWAVKQRCGDRQVPWLAGATRRNAPSTCE
jgi:hypothetical protein